MKYVYIIRHAPKDDITGQLTREGRILAYQVGQSLKDTFSIVISSEAARAQETALLLTGKKPHTDSRANIIPLSLNVYEQLRVTGSNHPQKVTGALYEDHSLRPTIVAKVAEMIDLIKNTHKILHGEEKALIVSHDVLMVPTYQTLIFGSILQEARQFAPLSGFKYAGRDTVSEISW